MKNVILSLLLLTALTGFSQQVAKNLTAANGVFIGFYEFKPADYTPAKKYPLIIFMHGIGERGNGSSEISRVKAQGIPKYISYGHKMTFTWNGKTETFLVLSPQLSSSYGSWPSFYAEEMIKYAKSNLSIDTNRIFVTGLSLGGGGTWKYAISNLNNSKSIAALAPVCGTQQSGDYCNIAKANLPVWAFHSENDPTVSVNATKNQINSVNNCNPLVKPLTSIWPTGGHAMWDRAYDTVYKWQSPNIYEWFLAQNKSLPVNQLPVANAGADMMVSINGAANLDASHSYDPDGKILRYIWKQISGPVNTNIVDDTASNHNTQVTGFTATGIYTYELKIVDDRASVSTAKVNVTVSANLAPTANAGNDATFSTKEIAQLKGIASDIDGTISFQQWTMVSGPASVSITNSNSLDAQFSTTTAGIYIFKLQVKDNSGAISEDQVSITMTLPLNQGPVAIAGADQIIAPSVADLDGTKSYDDKKINVWRWKQVSGPTSALLSSTTTATTKVSGLVPGVYKFRLRIWDIEGVLSYDDIVITVK